MDVWVDGWMCGGMDECVDDLKASGVGSLDGLIVD